MAENNGDQARRPNATVITDELLLTCEGLQSPNKRKLLLAAVETDGELFTVPQLVDVSGVTLKDPFKVFRNARRTFNEVGEWGSIDIVSQRPRGAGFINEYRWLATDVSAATQNLSPEHSLMAEIAGAGPTVDLDELGIPVEFQRSFAHRVAGPFLEVGAPGVTEEMRRRAAAVVGRYAAREGTDLLAAAETISVRVTAPSKSRM